MSLLNKIKKFFRLDKSQTRQRHNNSSYPQKSLINENNQDNLLENMASKARGDRGERMAEKHLKKLGMKLIGRNFHSRFGEIDLIFVDKDTLVFVEVKYRSRDEFGLGREAVDKNKQRKIIKTANYFILRNKKYYDSPVRFDVVEYDKEKVAYIKDAFWQN